MEFSQNDTALVVIDPQIDVLSDKGISWGLVGESVKENNTVENLARLFTAAKQADYGVFISPHYLYPHIRLGNMAAPSNTGCWTTNSSSVPTHSVSKGSQGRARTGCRDTSRLLKTGKLWSSVHIRCGDRKPMIWFFSSVNGESTRSSYAGCWLTSASKAICGSYWNRDLRSRW